jgi:hypothetical protein
MDTETLTDVIAIINTRIANLRNTSMPTLSLEDMVKINELELLINHLELKQRAIEAAVAQIEGV